MEREKKRDTGRHTESPMRVLTFNSTATKHTFATCNLYRTKRSKNFLKLSVKTLTLDSFFSPTVSFLFVMSSVVKDLEYVFYYLCSCRLHDKANDVDHSDYASRLSAGLRTQKQFQHRLKCSSQVVDSDS